jgi:hypothetical protein
MRRDASDGGLRIAANFPANFFWMTGHYRFHTTENRRILSHSARFSLHHP